MNTKPKTELDISGLAKNNYPSFFLKFPGRHDVLLGIAAVTIYYTYPSFGGSLQLRYCIAGPMISPKFLSKPPDSGK